MTYRPEKVYSFAISTLILVRLSPTCLSFGTAIAVPAVPVLVSRASPSYIKERERVWRMNLHPLVPVECK